jgi:hypothetical protein
MEPWMVHLIQTMRIEVALFFHRHNFVFLVLRQLSKYIPTSDREGRDLSSEVKELIA